jgi:formamidopyrimidine-DNA glycosylase
MHVERMPELPEVETTLRALRPRLLGQVLVGAEVRQPKLRWPVTKSLAKQSHNQMIQAVSRRGKYLMVQCDSGGLLIHLGMSGHLRWHQQSLVVWGKHDHVILALADGSCVCFHDPRRFGAMLWQQGLVQEHRLLAHLGIEPLGSKFTGAWLYEYTRGVKRPIKQVLMDQKVVVGVGNIYAQEALFAAGILPSKSGCDVALESCDVLVKAVRRVLRAAIKAGGSSLQDYYAPDGGKGYFQMAHQVYGRYGACCVRCEAPLLRQSLAGRTTIYCGQCQS